MKAERHHFNQLIKKSEISSYVSLFDFIQANRNANFGLFRIL